MYGDVVAELNNSGAVTASYVLGGSGIISQTRSTTTNYYLADAQGSTRALTTPAAAITDTYRYSAFGEIEAQTGTTTNNYLYTGQQFDSSTGLYSLRARYYDAAVGRFLSRDTWAIDRQNPMELNRYVYAAGNPVRWADPSGQSIALNDYGSSLSNSIRQSFGILVQVGRAALPYVAVSAGILLLLGASDTVRDIPDVRPGTGEGNPAEDGEGSTSTPTDRPVDLPDWNPPTGDYVPTPGEGGDWNGGQPPNGDPTWRIITEWLMRIVPWLLPHLLPDTGGGDGGGTGTDPDTGDDEQRQAIHIALGLERPIIDNGLTRLERFTQNLRTMYGPHVYNYREWNSSIIPGGPLTLRNPSAQFFAAFQDTVYDSRVMYIHFNLEGILQSDGGYANYQEFVSQIAVYTTGYCEPNGDRVTAWELCMIINDRDGYLLLKTIFYENGTTSLNPFPFAP
jgi:RHS repeat-associated protein